MIQATMCNGSRQTLTVLHLNNSVPQRRIPYDFEVVLIPRTLGWIFAVPRVIPFLPNLETSPKRQFFWGKKLGDDQQYRVQLCHPLAVPETAGRPLFSSQSSKGKTPPKYFYFKILLFVRAHSCIKDIIKICKPYLVH